MRPEQNGWHYPADIYKYILVNEHILILNSPKLVIMDSIENNIFPGPMITHLTDA